MTALNIVPALTSYQPKSWMGDLRSSIGNKKLWQLSLPGTHNAGMDRYANYSNSYITCQYDTFWYHLESGIRVLDIRLKYFSGYSNTGLRFRHTHSQESGRTLSEMMNAVREFLHKNPTEIVILDIHELSTQKGTPVPFQELHNYFVGEFGSALVPRAAVNMTLNEIKANYPGGGIVLAAPNGLSNLNPTLIWSQINHRWAGSGLVSTSRLYSHIDSVMRNPPAAGALWSMSATCYSGWGVQNIKSELNNWYSIGSEWQRKSNIINVDFFNDSEIVRNCIESNLRK
ncbi:hypothetical protein JRG42_02270 [Pseudomonas granadensis]|uniref:Phosphatidylinositol diacylglycerol-lyase n=1 Tax=Pseudomonas granadensis TaxID=1421430 RepID=A0ABX7GFN6_9PSED|nr:hypothetical protein [Pseudomonas granadensis]MBN6771938.1 hypothetical protein [Pseudomonas granadensis]MBN6803286.1 hypothetical protein [Pseudomonas granadensis]MBN6829789.1 hypothetical protein [Pseudomonas granadensis]MBN6837507.1 hypothetical protein [Pseudomonas granadensis]MBN6866153.1 hypothetical protein [Pseudomonas granadensis]